jgi:FKBP12-rapamycin complex-associated protein
VPATDTVHYVIKQFRDAQHVQLNIEQRLMMKLAPDYQQLTVIQKVEIFEQCLQLTAGQDLARALWLKSPNAESWLDRRSNYTTSLAVMSMVGYILGLGDRHPCNLMLARHSGKLIHIDFGDCFDVAMHRDRYPEKVPFRLTRMLVQAMEISGIDGSYRHIAEAVMALLRKNSNSLMALLEAFVHDPLINWRLIDNKKHKGHEEEKEKELESKADNDDNEVNPSSNNNTNNAGDKIIVGSIQSNRSSDRRRSLAELENFTAEGTIIVPTEQLNDRALSVISRIGSKLKGTDFLIESSVQQVVLDIPAQVSRLIEEATSHLNLSQSYIGWCPFW